MADSPAHKFGQIVGVLVESVVLPQLEEFCKKQGLYLDYQKKNRPARRGKKVSWTDKYGNIHDLDFVIERDGTDNIIGNPVAFIEVAWRRYTKHSRNKVQEIQGAILPLAEKYGWNNPFLGTILAGVFTAGSIEQLRSLGFTVLYFPYETITAAFKSENIDISFNEETSDKVFYKTALQIQNTPAHIMKRIREHLIVTNSKRIDDFFTALISRLGRQVTRVVIIPLYGKMNEFATIEGALRFINEHRIYEGSGEFRKYELRVEFTNGDKVDAFIEAKEKVKEFLEFVQRQ